MNEETYVSPFQFCYLIVKLLGFTKKKQWCLVKYSNSIRDWTLIVLHKLRIKVTEKRCNFNMIKRKLKMKESRKQ